MSAATCTAASTKVNIQPENVSTLLDSLNIELPAESEDGVTRSDFIYTVMQLLGGGSEIAPSETNFGDVDAESKASGAIALAEAYGIISGGSSFRPDDAITLNEALKIIIVATGYAYEAEQNGGFPLGYRMQASTLKVDTNIADPVDYNGFLSLMSDMLYIDLRLPDKVGSDGTYSITKNNTILNEYFNAYPVKGIVTANAYTSIYSADGGRSGYVEIDGERFKGEGFDDMLGMNVRGYALEDSGDYTILCLVPYNNSTFSASYDDIEVNPFKLVDEDGKSKSIHIDSAPLYIYNGKAIETPVNSNIEYGYYTFLDNDNDENYDIVFINEAKTVVAEKITATSVTDANGGIIDFSDIDTDITIMYGGNEIKPTEIPSSAVLNVYTSKDGKLISIDVSTESASFDGFKYAIDDDELTVGGTTYTLSPYFLKNYSKRITGKTAVSFLLDSFGNIAAASDSSDAMKYGFILKGGSKSNMNSDIELRIITDFGAFKDYVIADKVVADGASMSAEKCFENVIKHDGAVKEQLIRYSLNADGKLKTIDTAYENSAEIYGTLPDDYDTKNALTRYNFRKNTTTGTVYYKRSLSSVGTHFTVTAGTPLFMVSDNTAVDDEERASLMSFPSLTDDYPFVAANLEVYDVDKTGTAHAAVYRCNENEINGILDAKSTSAVVWKLSPAVNADGDNGVEITVCLSKEMRFETYFIKNMSLLDNLYTDESRSDYSLSNGDIIRFVLNAKNEICNVTKDFDASSKTILFARSGENEILRYYLGTAYSSADSRINISSALLPAPVDVANGVSYCLKIPSNILLCEGKSLRPVSPKEIVNYTDSADGADTIVMLTTYVDPYAIVIYR